MTDQFDYQNQLNNQLGQLGQIPQGFGGLAQSVNANGTSGSPLTLGNLQRAYQQIAGGAGGGAIAWSAATMAMPGDWKPNPPQVKVLSKEEQLKKWLKYKILNLPSQQ
jgi:hypothetical protein